MTDDAPATKPEPGTEAWLLASADHYTNFARGLLGLVPEHVLTTEERADLDGALMHLAKVQRSLQARRDGRGT